MAKRFVGFSLWKLLLIIAISSCEKEKKPNNEIDVSNQWSIDPFGVVISSSGEDQWNKKIFTASELSLFISLDTTNLAGTITPATVRETSNYPFPNPFVNNHSFAFKFNDSFSGEVVLKYVVVDNKLNIIDKKVAKLKANSGYAAIAISPAVAIAQYRLYYTLSSQANVHFYQSWGNIQKVR
jgi:hypothetical protein